MRVGDADIGGQLHSASPKIEDVCDGVHVTDDTFRIFHGQDDLYRPLRYVSPMEPHHRLKQARVRSGFETAADAAEAFGWPMVTYRAHENGTRGLRMETAERYAKAFRISTAWLLTGEGSPNDRPNPVRIVGLVGANPDGSVLYAEGDGNLGEAPMPPGGTAHTVALETRGDSQRGIAEDGWLIYYDERRDPPSPDMFNELCVVGLADGRVLIKFLIPRPDEYFDLESVSARTLREVAVDWAALVTAIVPRKPASRLVKQDAGIAIQNIQRENVR